MKTRLLIAITLFAGAIMLTNCGDKKDNKEQKTEKKANPVQEKFNKDVEDAIKKDGVTIKAGEEALKAEKDGKAFTGEVWSIDGKSYKMDFKDGAPAGSTTFHKNGKPAIVAAPEGGEKYYDEDGKEMEVDKFMEKYEKYIDEIGPQMESVFARTGIAD